MSPGQNCFEVLRILLCASDYRANIGPDIIEKVLFSGKEAVQVLVLTLIILKWRACNTKLYIRSLDHNSYNTCSLLPRSIGEAEADRRPADSGRVSLRALSTPYPKSPKYPHTHTFIHIYLYIQREFGLIPCIWALEFSGKIRPVREG